MEHSLEHIRCGFCGKMLFPSDSFMQCKENDQTVCYCNEIHHELAISNLPLADISAKLTDWTSPRDCSASAHLDPITFEVVKGALMTIGEEMAFTMERTAYSPIFSEGRDFTCAIFDTNLELIAQQEGLPAQLGAMKYGVQGAVRHFGFDNIHPGDILFHNDSYRGTPHLPECCMVMPVFYREKIIAFIANIAHHADVGGKAAGSMPGDATEIFQEGIIIPPVKLFKEGKEVEEVWRIYLNNVRTRESSLGDLYATYGALLIGEKRYLELVEKYGLETLNYYVNEFQKYSERRMRAEIRKIPNGIYHATTMLDDDGIVDRPFKVDVSLLVADEDMIFDYRGTDEAAMGPVNTPYGVMVSASVNAIFNLVDPTIPHNEGMFRPLHFICPPGKLLNCTYPSPLSGGNSETHNLICEAIVAALAEAVPDRVVAPSGATSVIMTGGGYDDRRKEWFSFCNWDSSGWGARYNSDGNSAITTWVGPRAQTNPTETVETRYPWEVVRYCLLEGSGGSGEYRGGLGIRRDYRITASEMTIGAHANREKYPCQGMKGGKPGTPTHYRIVRKGRTLKPSEIYGNLVSDTKFSGVKLVGGDVVVLESPGGGGYGEPSKRKRDHVVDDLKNGYITRQQAIEDYGLSAIEADNIIHEFHFRNNE